ncbi:MAG TPA: hypothetical protein VKV30_14845 [Candidatus Angelobacter sp.]|nr:hypothetical protein [Candidatus Angelobacter sp.]
MLRPYVECVADAKCESIIHQGVKKEKGQRLKPGALRHPYGPAEARALIRTRIHVQHDPYRSG